MLVGGKCDAGRSIVISWSEEINRAVFCINIDVSSSFLLKICILFLRFIELYVLLSCFSQPVGLGGSDFTGKTFYALISTDRILAKFIRKEIKATKASAWYDCIPMLDEQPGRIVCSIVSIYHTGVG